SVTGSVGSPGAVKMYDTTPTLVGELSHAFSSAITLTRYYAGGANPGVVRLSVDSPDGATTYASLSVVKNPTTAGVQIPQELVIGVGVFSGNTGQLTLAADIDLATAH